MTVFKDTRDNLQLPKDHALLVNYLLPTLNRNFSLSATLQHRPIVKAIIDKTSDSMLLFLLLLSSTCAKDPLSSPLGTTVKRI